MISLTTDVLDLILQKTLLDSTLGINSCVQQMTTGYKVNHAKDNAAGFSIIEALETKISSMLQIQQNTSESVSLLQTAEGGLEEINGLLERLRELTMQAANGTYDAASRASMQAEADSILEQIEVIKSSTSYNGQNLLQTVRNVSSKANITSLNSASCNITASTSLNNVALFAEQNSVVTTSATSTQSLLDGSIELAAKETQKISIDGVEYTITNKNTSTNSLSYSKDTSTGEITFICNNMTIKGQADVAHKYIINGNLNSVYGGDKADSFVVLTKSTNNTCYGGAGNDIFDLRERDNAAYGQNGDDCFYGNYSYTYLYGGNGNDTFYLNYSNITATGSAGDDIFNILNNTSYDILYGGDGEDTFNVTGNNHYIDGGSGVNSITGSIGSGTTTLNVPNANSVAWNLAGNETKKYSYNGIEYTIKNNSSSSAEIVVTQRDDGFVGFNSNKEVEIYGQSDVVHKVYSKGSEIFHGGNLDDILYLYGSAGKIYGHGGNDTIYVDANYGTGFGGDGNDTIIVGKNDVSVLGSAYGEAGDDNIILYSKQFHQFAYGGVGDDTITVNKGKYNVAVGGSGNDTIVNSDKCGVTAGFGNDDENNGYFVFAKGETKNVKIGGISYTITNKSSNEEENILAWNYNSVTGQITLGGRDLEIVGDNNVKHNIKLLGYQVTLKTGQKDDIVEDQGYTNYIYTYDGNDTIYSNAKFSTIFSGDGDDNIFVNIYSTIYAGNGDDTITTTGNYGAYIYGEKGNDKYIVNGQSNVIDTEGDNVYEINCSSAKISGGVGSDTFYVNGSNNTVMGAGGDDYFVISGSNNTIDGGVGTNLYVDNGTGNTLSNVNSDPNSGTLNFSYAGEVRTLNLGGRTLTIKNNNSSSNTLSYSFNTNTDISLLEGSNFEILGDTDSSNNLSIKGSNNTIKGGNLADKITIESGSNNIVDGGNGNDALVMNSTNNSILGGDGDDTITLNASTNLLVDAGAGNDNLNIKSANNTNIVGGSGNNTITVEEAKNTISVDDGNNTIKVNSANNNITAGNGNNKFSLSGNENVLVAGSGKNTLGLSGDSNQITLENAVDTINIIGNSNNVLTQNGENTVVIKGDNNGYETENGKKKVSVVGNNNTVQGGVAADEFKIKGNSNIIKGGDGDDKFSIQSGRDNILYGEGGAQNILTGDFGTNTQYDGIEKQETTPFKVSFKVGIGSDESSTITTTIDFNTLGLFVDLSSRETALESLETIDATIKKTQDSLTSIGATINRLYYAMESQSIKLENYISSRSTMRDTDIADVSSKFIMNQIFQQASSTLLHSTRNLKAENVLGLLQGLN